MMPRMKHQGRCNDLNLQTNVFLLPRHGFARVGLHLVVVFVGGSLLCSTATSSTAAELPGIRATENFVLSAPSKELTLACLTQAEHYRKRIALEWLGYELPPGTSFADVQVTLLAEGEKDSGRLWLANRETERPHMMWLTGSREEVLGAGMAHEMAHVVLAARFPNGMPAWANEGIASSYDNAERADIRRRIMQRIIEASGWPSIDELLEVEQIAPNDQTAYALASSLTEFLISLADRETFISFIANAQQSDWDAAIEKTYRMEGRRELQIRWQQWAAAPRTIL